MRRRKRRGCRRNNQIKVASRGTGPQVFVGSMGWWGLMVQDPTTQQSNKTTKNGDSWMRGEEGSEGEG